MSKFLDETGLAYFWDKIKAALSTVAFTGSYNDLSNKPNIPASSTVDTALSSTSENPIQNKVINTALGTKANDSDVVKLSGNQTINDTKTFSSKILCAKGTVLGTTVDNSFVKIIGGTSNDHGAYISLDGKDSINPGQFSLRAHNGTTSHLLAGRADGTLQWDGKNIAIDENVVHKTGDETISGTKTYTNNQIISKNTPILALRMNNIDCSQTSTTTQIQSAIAFSDKNGTASNNRTGSIRSGMGNADYGFIQISAYNPDPASTAEGHITVAYPRNGTPYATAPTTPTGSTGNEIVTANYFNDTVVKLSGNQTIADFKVFTDSVRSTGSAFSLVDQTSVKGTPPSADKSQYVYFFDKVDDPEASSYGTAHVMASIKHLYAKTSGNNSLQLIVYTPTTGGTANKLISFRATPAGAYAFLPGTNNDIDLGGSSNKWANVYATTFIGNVTGNCSGTSSNVTGTIAIANGGTGATTRLNAIKALTNEDVSTNATHFLGLKSDWSKVGYFSLAECKTLLGLGTAAYTASTAYASASHTHSYLPLTGGTLTGTLSQSCAVPTYNCFDTDLTKGTNPSSAQWLGLLFCDKTGNSGTKYRAGAVETSVTKTGETQTYLRAYNWKADTTTEEHIAICYPKDGTPYTIAPTPATSDNSTKIATTAYVKAQGYITSSGSITGSSGSCTGNSNTATTATYLSVPTYTGDLNALETSGIYYATDGTNYPVGSNGQVIVIKKANFIRQFFFRAGTINSNEYQNYSREKNISTGEWGEWYWFVNSKHLPLSIARGGTGSETRLDAVKALLNESVTSPDYFLGITTSWAKGGYVSIANAKTALGVNIYANIKIGHINGNATYTLPSGGTWAWALIKDGRGTPSKTGSNAGGTVLKNDWDTDWGAVYIAVRTA